MQHKINTTGVVRERNAVAEKKEANKANHKEERQACLIWISGRKPRLCSTPG